MIWSDLDSVVTSNASFLFSSHVGLDGDSIGSQLAMYWHLTSLSKRVTVYNNDALPHKFGFLTNARRAYKQETAWPVRRLYRIRLLQSEPLGLGAALRHEFLYCQH